MTKRLLALAVAAIMLIACFSFTASAEADTFAMTNKVLGDMNGDSEKNTDDAIYLLYNVFFGDGEYPLAEDPDVNGDGEKNADDAIYLLYNSFFGDSQYPLYPEADDDDNQGGEDVGGGQGGDNEWTGNY